MDDALTRRHQIDRPGLDQLLRAQRVAVKEGTFIHIGHGGEVDVRMRAHVDPLPRADLGRAGLIEEDEGADHRALPDRQGPIYPEIAQIMAGGRDGLKNEIVCGHGASNSG